ncbi:B3 domain-containing protein [Quillaja saponaria]|uniref:B3 domain-containing protein n=1 Tax=Quillaja saponaria TaxID=32244 RepID=A0AAD7L3M0_QUISA|nr:B3 domain-containing protein [Quillaja saponaria]
MHFKAVNMTSGDRRRNDHLPATMKLIQFFKIILDGALRDGKLRIPRKFLMKYGKGLSNSMLLKLPNGAEWRVNLTKHNGEVWIQDGWKEFADYYSLCHGYLVLFKCESSSCFHVHIFDFSAVEIDYPDPINNGSAEEAETAQGLRDIEPNEILDESDDDSVEILDNTDNDSIIILDESDNDSVNIIGESPSHPKRKQKSLLPCPKPCKMMKTNSGSSKLESMPDMRKENPSFRVEITRSGGKKFSNSELNHHLHSTNRDYKGHRNGDNQVAPNPISPENEAPGLAFLHDHFTTKGHPNPLEKVKLEEPSKLEKPIDQGKHSSKLATQTTSTLSHSVALEAALLFKPENPFFIVTISLSISKRWTMRLPGDFLKEHFEHQRQHKDLMLQVGDRNWPIKLLIYPKHGSGWLSAGWSAFTKENNLQVGDVCVIELIKRDEVVLKVSIFRLSS